MKPCFDRVSACVKGYLTRRLLKTEKVQEIITTIQVILKAVYKNQPQDPGRAQIHSYSQLLIKRIHTELDKLKDFSFFKNIEFEKNSIIQPEF